MRVILDATGYRPGMTPLTDHRPTPMLRVVGRPILVHVIDTLVQAGAEPIETVLHNHCEQIENLLGGGERWGISVTYHLVKDHARPLTSIQPASYGWSDDMVLLACADYLPALNLSENNKPVVWLAEDGSWTGWALIPRRLIENTPRSSQRDEIEEILRSECPSAVAPRTMDTRAFRPLLHSNMSVLAKPESILFPAAARQIEAGVWISRGAQVDPGATLRKPTYIGEGCQIGRGAVIGPHSVVEDWSIVDHDTIVERSLVCRNSYVGPGLHLADSIIDRNLLVNVSQDTQVSVTDDFILGELNGSTHRSWGKPFIGRCLAATLLVLLSPIVLAAAITSPVSFRDVLSLPAPLDPRQWSTVRWLDIRSRNATLGQRLCGLFNVVRGHGNLVGLPPRTPEEVEQLPTDWKNLYLSSKVGLLTLENLHEEGNHEPEAYSAEAYYAAKANPLLDLQILYRWLRTANH
jgi:hypothetical protein